MTDLGTPGPDSAINLEVMRARPIVAVGAHARHNEALGKGARSGD
jgi:hypothetical protein